MTDVQQAVREKYGAIAESSRRHADSVWRMTVAVDGHADVNSTDVCTSVGTSARAIRVNPNLGKKSSAVVVNR